VQIHDTIKKEQEEVLIIEETNAIVNPRAMMIHLQYTSAAHSAMVATVWLVLATPLAMSPVT
jgi:hypothetical protein